MNSQNLYENTYKSKKHFSFGKNWQNFISSLTEEKIGNARKLIVDFLGGEDAIRGKTFVDIGCGSGLFSHVAYKLGAARVVSVDVDEFSVACTQYLKEKQNNPENWEIKQGSALDEKFIKSLGKFDIVYSWGVLHHTGDMYRAFDVIANLMHDQSELCIAIYGRNGSGWTGSPETWLKVKKVYNRSGKIGKKLLYFGYVVYFFAVNVRFKQNPWKKINSYKERGMEWSNDVIDWLGGYPYEFAWPKEIIGYFEKKGMSCKKINDRNGIACNEYLFIRKQDEK